MIDEVELTQRIIDLLFFFFVCAEDVAFQLRDVEDKPRICTQDSHWRRHQKLLYAPQGFQSQPLFSRCSPPNIPLACVLFIIYAFTFCSLLLLSYLTTRPCNAFITLTT
jgi:hypothetical protein